MLPAKVRGPRWVSPEPLNVAPHLVGQPLAGPKRRAGAMAIDLFVISLLSGVGGLWLVAGLVLVGLQLRSQRGGSRWRTVVGWGFAGLMLLLAVDEAWDRWGPDRAPRHADTVAAVAADPPASAASAPSDAERIEQLEAEIAELRKPRPLKLRDEFDHLLDAAGASFGWGIVYFSLLPALWGGQTLGKKLLRLRVVELTGKPMTVMRCLRRYGGYAAGMTTGGLGFAQALWDANCQAIQDRTAHTVVLDLREPALVPAAAPAAPSDAVSGSTAVAEGPGALLDQPPRD